MSELHPADLVDAETLRDAMRRELTGVTVLEANGDWFVCHDPDGTTPPERNFPFCTLVTGDRYDAASNLDRDPAAYRINLGVRRETYRQHFGPAPRQAAGREVIDLGVDYTATDTLLPHPFYAPLHWLCVVNPGERTRNLLAELIDEAHGLAAR